MARLIRAVLATPSPAWPSARAALGWP